MVRHFACACALVAAISAAHSSLAFDTAAMQSRAQMALAADQLAAEITQWLASNFDLPAISEKPAIEFASAEKLGELRYQPQASKPADSRHDKVFDAALGGVVALYLDSTRTVLLLDSWTGSTPADQSVLVHEMVHHVQNVAGMKSECPMAREKLAYRAQNLWLRRFGTDLENEFQLDPLTVLVNSSCM